MWQKLKREWKTFSLAIMTLSIGTWEAARDSGYDLTPIVPEKWRPYALPGVGLFFLVLRQWRDLSKVKDESDK